jgi:hypothetical protein
MHLRDERRLMLAEERVDARQSHDEVSCQLWQRCLADDNEQRHTVSLYRGQLVGFVADAPVVGNGAPALAADKRQPFSSGAVGAKWSACRSTRHPAARRVSGNCFPRSRSVKKTTFTPLVRRRRPAQPPLP